MTFFNSIFNSYNNNIKRTIVSLLHGGVDILINLTWLHYKANMAIYNKLKYISV